MFQEFLPESDRDIAEKAGGVIAERDYRKRFRRGLE